MPLAQTPAYLLLALDQASNPILVTDACLDQPGPRILYINQAFTQMTGYQLSEMKGQSPRILQGELTNRKELDRLTASLKGGENFKGSNVNYRKDGSPYLVEWNIAPVRAADGQVTHYISIQRDVSQRREEEHFSRTLLNNIGEGVFGVDPQGRFTFINPAALRMLGYSSEQELLGKSSHAVTHHTHVDCRPYPEEDCPIYKVINQGVSIQNWDEDWFWRKDGTGFAVEIYATPLWQELGQVFGGVVTFRNISERKRLEKELQELAYHDQLTGLYNRHIFYDLLEKEIERSRRYQTRFSLVMFDLDHFKQVNDTYGHDVGDQVLVQVAELARQRVRKNDSVCRWGGEEFMLLLPETSLNRACQLADSFRESIAQADFPKLDQLTASLGVAEYIANETSDDLTQRVDTALYRAKAEGRNRVVTLQKPFPLA